MCAQEANLVEEVEDSPDQSYNMYNSPVEHRFPIELDWSTNGQLPDCDCKYVSVWTMSPGFLGGSISFHHSFNVLFQHTKMMVSFSLLE